LLGGLGTIAISTQPKTSGAEVHSKHKPATARHLKSFQIGGALSTYRK
jgi:hypothetical protein